VGKHGRSSFCEQKEAKKLYPLTAGTHGSRVPYDKSFFASFFPKKEASCLPALCLPFRLAPQCLPQ
jgi:hypothetical protein